MKIYYWTPEFPLKIKGGTLQGHVQCVKGGGGGCYVKVDNKSSRQKSSKENKDVKNVY